jgi:hypothetical protein
VLLFTAVNMFASNREEELVSVNVRITGLFGVLPRE